MIVLRTILVALLTVSFTMSAAARCPVAASVQSALAHTANEMHALMDHGAQASKGNAAHGERRACDVMVQVTAPQCPAVLSPSTSYVGLLSTVDSFPAKAAPDSAVIERPPNRAQRFKDVYARTGRRLV